jgi:hypothetical protein
MATSYNGWPASPDKAEIGVVSSDVFPGGAKAGDVTVVLRYVARQLDARVEPCIDGWNWGYTYKANVNNPSQLSCHASGTAIDWNAPDHPNGSSGTFTSAQRGTIYQILDEVQGSVSWLEGYDEMHFEICVNAADLAQVAALLGDAAPPQPEGDWFDMATEEDLRRIVGEEIDARLGAIGVGVWTTSINERGAANELLASAQAAAQAAADGIGHVGVTVWTTPVTEEPANVLLARAAGPA